MKTDIITVSSRGRHMEEALEQVDKLSAYKGLSPKGALHLRLLTEEMMGMMRSITGETEGRFWIEDEEGVYRLHLQVETRMDSGKRERLLSASSSGRNDAARGLMGRLRDFFDRGADEDIAAYASPMLLSGMFEASSTPALDLDWSMVRYEEALAGYDRESNQEALEAWDELEKSVVARVADDVRVSIRGRDVEMVIVKKLA
ncbi:MAG: hypothetical protein IKH77_08460 [Clostridia bacterium]|nr:hypothetical protein [Clostridia bacterium]